MGDKYFFTIADYRDCFKCGYKKARKLMERAGIVRIGRKPVVPAANHKAYLEAGDFSVDWSDSRRKPLYVKLRERRDSAGTE